MPRGKAKEIESPEMEVQEAEDEKKTAGNTKDNLRDKMIEVGLKLCDDLMNGKARSEETSLKAIVEIYEAIKGV